MGWLAYCCDEKVLNDFFSEEMVEKGAVCCHLRRDCGQELNSLIKGIRKLLRGSICSPSSGSLKRQLDQVPRGELEKVLVKVEEMRWLRFDKDNCYVVMECPIAFFFKLIEEWLKS